MESFLGVEDTPCIGGNTSTFPEAGNMDATKREGRVPLTNTYTIHERGRDDRMLCLGAIAENAISPPVSHTMT